MNTDLQKTYDRISEDWHADHSADNWWHEGTNEFLNHIPKRGQILDVGCGAGTKARYMIERGYLVFGIDFSRAQIAIARREVPQAEFKELAMEQLDELEEKFDGVFAQASLLHIQKENAGNIVKKMAERLKPHGLLYIAVKEVRDGQNEEMVKENDYGYEYERFFSYFTMGELEEYLTDSGLKIISKLRNQSPSGKTVWLQIIGQK